jgi:hypothetical protein
VVEVSTAAVVAVVEPEEEAEVVDTVVEAITTSLYKFLFPPVYTINPFLPNANIISSINSSLYLSYTVINSSSLGISNLLWTIRRIITIPVIKVKTPPKHVW